MDIFPGEIAQSHSCEKDLDSLKRGIWFITRDVRALGTF